MNDTEKVYKQQKLIVRVCHACGHVHESSVELERCQRCNKAFLPLNYFSKVHKVHGNKFHELFAESEQLEEKDLIKGLYVLW